MADSLSSLERIKREVRYLSECPSENLLSNSELLNYINSFILCDFAAEFQLDELETTFSFYTDPNVDTYDLCTTDVTSDLYNFKNIYSQVYDPAYIQGYGANLIKSKVLFNGLYIPIPVTYEVGSGNAVKVNFTGTLDSIPVLRNTFKINALDINDDGLEAHDDGEGNLAGNIVVGGTIDYLTGVFDLTFTTAVKNLEEITAYYETYYSSRPTTILYANNKLKFRPVPDLMYKVELSVTKRPTELLADDDCPELTQWWEYIALGSAMKILQRNNRMEKKDRLQAEFKRQQSLVRYKTIRNNSNPDKDFDINALPANKRGFFNW